MKKKLLFIITGYAFILTLGLVSCIKCGPFPNRYKVIALDWSIYRTEYSDLATSKFLLSPIINDSVEYDSLAIVINPRTETYYANAQRKFSLNLINRAYACSPDVPITEERIDCIMIKSEKDFDPLHPAGTDLSDVFDIEVVNHGNYGSENYPLNDYLEMDPFVPDQMTLLLKSPPDSTMSFEFKVEYYQDGVDYNYFEFTTNKVVLKNE